MKRQVVYVGTNGVKVVIDGKSDFRNVQLFNKVLKNA